MNRIEPSQLCHNRVVRFFDPETLEEMPEEAAVSESQEKTADQAETPDAYRWPGRELESEAELQFSRARHYDPTPGRWLSRDPLAHDASQANVYRYVDQPGQSEPSNR